MSRKILLGVTGSVAAVLTGKIIDRLRSLGEVKVVFTEKGYYFCKANAKAKSEFDRVCGIMTEHAHHVYRETSEWPEKFEIGDDIQHIKLRDWADILVVAPLSANTMAKVCYGMCDNLLTSVIRAWDNEKPIVAAPAMNTKMWYNPPTNDHVCILQNTYDWEIIPPVEKELACGETGTGAMAPVDSIIRSVSQHLYHAVIYSDAS